MATTYAIISLGGKQYRVSEGERLFVDRVPTEEGKTFHPEVLMIGGDGNVDLAPKVQVTAKVVGSQLGEKIRIGKYKAKTGYRRRTGFRAKLSQIEIQSIGGKRAASKEPEAAPAKLPGGYTDLNALRGQVGLAVAAEHQHIRVEGLALRGREAVDKQALAFADAVLLPAE